MRNVLMSAEDHARITAAVAAAEANSDGEISTMVARQSDDYGDWAIALAGLAPLLLLSLIAFLPGRFRDLVITLSDSWHGQPSIGELFGTALAAQLLVFALTWLALRWMPLRLALTPAKIKAARVRREAIRAFRVGIEARTRASTGVLIFLSLAEHRAELVADSAIDSKVSAERWGDAMAALIAETRAGRPAEGIVRAVTLVGALIAQHFPRSHDDSNEMPDRLIEL